MFDTATGLSSGIHRAFLGAHISIPVPGNERLSYFCYAEYSTYLLPLGEAT